MKFIPGTLTISSSPHAHSPNSTRRLMFDVCLALVPALIAAIWYFGWRCLTVVMVSVAACVFFEWAYRKIMKKENACADLSAVVTGILLAFVCPPTIPYWVVILGALFAIVLFSWPLFMNTWIRSGVHPAVFSNPTSAALDGLTAATPLASMSAGKLPAEDALDLFLGQTGGCIGEVCTAALLLGGVYLLLRRVITLRIPLSYLGTVAVLAFAFPLGGANRLDWMLCQLLSGGLMLGALFMATDYTTSPVTHAGQIAYGVGCGILTLLFRYFGSYPEGVTYAILIMNCCVGFFDKMGIPKRFGAVKKKGGEAA